MTKPMTDERLEELEESDNDTTFEMTQEIHRLREEKATLIRVLEETQGIAEGLSEGLDEALRELHEDPNG
jgi:hypothetical protein